MRHIRRLVAGMVAGLTLVVTLGGAAAPAAAASIYWVDDTPANNGKVKCPTTGTFPTIEAARAQIATDGVTSNVTLNICPGSYAPPGETSFSSFTNLKVIGKGGPYITAPNLFTGALFRATSSTKVTVQGLNISGGSHLGNSGTVAIEFDFTSGTIKGNTISRWHEAYTTTPATPAAPAYGIVDFAPGTVEKVTITKNSIYDSQEIGIYVYEAGKPKITKNRVVFSSAITSVGVFGIPPTTIKPQVGILVLYGAPGTLVTGNQILSDSDLHPTVSGSRGILLYSTSGAKVQKNTVRGGERQISVESYCDNASFPNANNNLITGNKLYDTWNYGVYIAAIEVAGGCAAPHADFNKVTGGNKIFNSRVADGFPWGARLTAGAPGVVDHNVVKGNTFAGFMAGSVISQAGDTNSTIAPNKILAAPPPGPLNAPPPDDGQQPGPLPAYIFNPT